MGGWVGDIPGWHQTRPIDSPLFCPPPHHSHHPPVPLFSNGLKGCTVSASPPTACTTGGVPVWGGSTAQRVRGEAVAGRLQASSSRQQLPLRFSADQTHHQAAMSARHKP